MNYLGNKEILNKYKIGFLCSRKVPASIILKTYDWAIKQRDEGKCVISGFHSKIEQDIFEILLKGKQPIIWVLARGLKKSWSEEIINAVANNRLLVISLFNEKVKRITSDHAKKRNEFICEQSNKICIPFLNKKGSSYKALEKYKHKMSLIV